MDGRDEASKLAVESGVFGRGRSSIEPNPGALSLLRDDPVL